MCVSTLTGKGELEAGLGVSKHILHRSDLHVVAQGWLACCCTAKKATSNLTAYCLLRPCQRQPADTGARCLHELLSQLVVSRHRCPVLARAAFTAVSQQTQVPSACTSCFHSWRHPGGCALTLVHRLLCLCRCTAAAVETAAQQGQHLLN